MNYLRCRNKKYLKVSGFSSSSLLVSFGVAVGSPLIVYVFGNSGSTSSSQISSTNTSSVSLTIIKILGKELVNSH